MRSFFICLIGLSLSTLVFGNGFYAPGGQNHGSIPRYGTNAKSTSWPLLCSDSIPYAKVVVYRPDNQLSRQYDLTTNLDGSFGMKQKEVKSMDAFGATFEVRVSAFSHKSESFSFVLSRNKTHYFRVQDRNNYSGTRPFLEVVEVTEEQYKKDLK